MLVLPSFVVCFQDLPFWYSSKGLAETGVLGVGSAQCSGHQVAFLSYESWCDHRIPAAFPDTLLTPCLRPGHPVAGINGSRSMYPLPCPALSQEWDIERALVWLCVKQNTTFIACWLLAPSHSGLHHRLQHSGKLLGQWRLLDVGAPQSSWFYVVLLAAWCPFISSTRNVEVHHSRTHDNVWVTLVCKSCKFFVVLSHINTSRCNQRSPWKIGMRKGAFAFKTHLNI